MFVEDCSRLCQTKSTLYWLLRIGGYSLEFEMRNMKKTKFGASRFYLMKLSILMYNEFIIFIQNSPL
jgi:hypothetical protein